MEFIELKREVKKLQDSKDLKSLINGYNFVEWSESLAVAYVGNTKSCVAIPKDPKETSKKYINTKIEQFKNRNYKIIK